MSVPLLAAGCLALKMSAADTALWFSISFVMHMVYGLVLGIVTSYGLSGVIRESPAGPSRVFASTNTIQRRTINTSIRRWLCLRKP
jgi:hypothetical protein